MLKLDIYRPDGCPSISARDAVEGQLYEIISAGSFDGYVGDVVFKVNNGDLYDFRGKFRLTHAHPNFTLRKLPTGAKVTITQE